MNTLICKRCGNEINYFKGWKCQARPYLTCLGYSGKRIDTPKFENKTPEKDQNK